MTKWREDVVEQLAKAYERMNRHEISVVDVVALERELSATEAERAEVKRREVARLVRPHLRVVEDDDRA